MSLFNDKNICVYVWIFINGTLRQSIMFHTSVCLASAKDDWRLQVWNSERFTEGKDTLTTTGWIGQFPVLSNSLEIAHLCLVHCACSQMLETCTLLLHWCCLRHQQSLPERNPNLGQLRRRSECKAPFAWVSCLIKRCFILKSRPASDLPVLVTSCGTTTQDWDS